MYFKNNLKSNNIFIINAVGIKYFQNVFILFRLLKMLIEKFQKNLNSFETENKIYLLNELIDIY